MKYLVKVPALNVVHVCGTVTTPPSPLGSTERPTGAIFEISARTYERGKKTVVSELTVICWANLAETVVAQVRVGDVVLITGSLQNHYSDRNAPRIVASVVQFLTSQTAPESE
jgi:single-stranded DNA-binding protein